MIFPMNHSEDIENFYEAISSKKSFSDHQVQVVSFSFVVNRVLRTLSELVLRWTGTIFLWRQRTEKNLFSHLDYIHPC